MIFGFLKRKKSLPAPFPVMERIAEGQISFVGRLLGEILFFLMERRGNSGGRFLPLPSSRSTRPRRSGQISSGISIEDIIEPERMKSGEFGYSLNGVRKKMKIRE